MNVVDDEFLPAQNRLKYQLSILKPYLHVRSCPTLLTKTVTLSALPDLPRWCHVLLDFMVMTMMIDSDDDDYGHEEKGYLAERANEFCEE